MDHPSSVGGGLGCLKEDQGGLGCISGDHGLMDCPRQVHDVLGHGQSSYGCIQGLITTYDGLGTH